MDAKNENVKIKVFASGRKQKSYDDSDEKRIIQVIREQVLPSAKAEYHSISVKVKRNHDYNPEYLIAYMKRKDTYTAEVVRVNVNNSFDVKGIEENYNDQDDFDDEEAMKASYDTEEIVDFVVATPEETITTAVKAVDYIFAIATDAGYKVKKLIGIEATVSNYKYYLQLGLKGFVNIGHGYEQGILLDDGRLRYTWFQGLRNRPLSPAVVYFNSCKVFNKPLLPEIMNAGARTFIGGIISLLIGESEDVCKAFWKTILTSREQMLPAIKNAESANYPVRGAHGIQGDQGPFKADKKVGILAVNNRFVCANGGGGQDLIANRTWIRTWEIFNLFYMTPDEIALQTSNFRYVCAEGGGGQELVANRHRIDTWETFALFKHPGNRISLMSFNGQYVCAEGGGSRPLIANRSDMGAWETFEFIPVKKIGLKANNNKYVCAEYGGGHELIANRDLLRSWETFVLAELGNNEVAIQCHNGAYVCAEDAGDSPLVANRNWIRTWEVFNMEKQINGKYAFRACNGKYVSAQGTNQLTTDSSTIGNNELFTIVEIDGNLELEFSARQEEYAHVEI